MSLHLIESRKILSAPPRRRGGAIASVALHAALVVGVFAVATAAPAPPEPAAIDDIIYVAPPKPDVPSTANHAAPARSAPVSAVSQPILPPLSEQPHISIDIPMVSSPLVVDPSIRDFSPRTPGATTTVGAPGTSGTPSGSNNSGAMNELEVDRPVMVLSGYRTPRYPEALRAAGVEETLNARFVVDTLGRIESGSLELTSAEHSAFAAAVRDALANARYRPAEVGGRRVRQQVTQAFVFSLRRN